MHIAGSPFTVDIAPGPTYPPATGVSWLSEQRLVVGKPVELLIQARDRFFNPRDEWGDYFELQLRYKPPLKPSAAQSSSLTLPTGLPSDEPLIYEGSVREMVRDGEPGQYLATVTATATDRPEREYTVVLTKAGAKADAERDALEAAARAAKAKAEAEEDEEEEMTEAQKKAADEAAEADLRAEAEADAAAEKILRAQNGLPPPPRLSFGTLATLMSRLNAWRRRGAAEAIRARKRNKRLYSHAVTYIPAPTSPPHCIVSGDGLWSAREMSRNVFTIQPIDRY
jgi:hypothetical protein